MTGKPNFRLFDISTRLGTLLRRPGGNARMRAISNAEQSVEQLRNRLCYALEFEIVWLSNLAENCGRAPAGAILPEIENRAKAIFNLAGTYNYESLMRIAASLLDLIALMRAQNVFVVDAIIVHTRAAQMLSPASPALDAVVTQTLLANLGKVIDRFRLMAA